MKKLGNSSQKVRYAVMGLGHIAQVAVLPAFQNARSNSELVALISDDPKKLEKLGTKYKVPKTAQFGYDQYPQCLQEAEVDVVYICLPNELHAHYAIEAMKSKVHVLCEKPLAISNEECDRLIQVSEENGVHLMTAYRLHFEKANLEAVKLSQKKLGPLKFFNSTFSFKIKDKRNIRLNPTEEGGGPLWDIGVYCINAARGLFRDEPTEVFAFTETSENDQRFQDTFEMISVNMRFPKNRLANFICSFAADAVASYDLVGTRGRIHLENAYEYATPRELQFFRDGKGHKKQKFEKADQFAAEILYFSQCVLKNKSPEPSAKEGRADVRVMEAILESIKTGKPVSLLPPKDDQDLEYPQTRHLIQRPGISEPQTVNVQNPSA